MTKSNNSDYVKLVKSISMLGLPIVHTFMIAHDYNILSDTGIKTKYFIDVLTILGPSLFLICMGINLSKSHKNYTNYIKTGLTFLKISLLLDFFRYIMPYLIALVFIGQNEKEFLMYFAASDIYILVGLFYLEFAFFMKYNFSKIKILMISIIMILINCNLDIHMSNNYLASILGNFIHVNTKSCFPLLSWSIYPIIGYILGLYTKHNSYKKVNSMMKIIFLSSIGILSISYITYYLLDKDYYKMLIYANNDYNVSLLTTILLIAIAGIVLSAFYHICNYINKNNTIYKFFISISYLLIPFYILQWIIVIYVNIVIIAITNQTIKLTSNIVLLLSLSITIFSLWLCKKCGYKITIKLLKFLDYFNNKSL